MADFLAKMKLILEGKEQVVSGLKETQQAMQKLSSTKVITTFDKEGVATGKQIEETFKTIKPTAEGASKGTNDFVNAMRRALIVAPVWMAIRTAMMAVTQNITEQIKFLIDLETAMARIQVVGKGTAQEFEQLKQTLTTLSVIYGVTASSAAEAAVIFAQQGRTVAETITLTRAAMIASQVLGTDMKTTVNDLTAAIEGFNIPIENSIAIIDKWINVERQFAVTSKDLADATKIAGATANQLGISIDSFLGNVTAVIEVTRKSGSEAARGLTFIYARLLTTGKDVLAQIAKVPVYLDEQKKATFALTNTYRSASDVLDDLASKWDNLTNKQRLSIAEQVASKRQLTVFMALMQNYNAAISARIASIASAGQAERAFGIIQETTAVKLQRLTSSWNSLTLAIGNTASFKVAIDSTIELLETLTALMNVTEAYKNAGTKSIDESNKEKDATILQARSLKDLIELRNKYLQVPPTETNIKILDQINSAIVNLQKNSKIKINIDAKDAITNLDKIIESGEVAKIQTAVDIEFNVDKATILKELKDLEFELGRVSITTILKRPELEKKQEKLIKDLANIEKARTEELNKRLSIRDVELAKEAATKVFNDEELEISEELTDAESEKLQIQEQLNLAKDSGVLTAKQLVDLEIQLTKNAIYTYDAHKKGVKLAELEIERRKAISDEYIKQRDVIRSQYIDFEKADVLEKERLRRLMELLKLSPTELERAFENDLFDQNVIIDYFNTFSKEGQDAINTMIQKLYDLPTIDLAKIFGGNINLANGNAAVTPVTNIKGAENININVTAGGMATAEEVVDLINKMIRDTTLADENFIQAFVKKIRPII